MKRKVGFHFHSLSSINFNFLCIVISEQTLYLSFIAFNNSSLSSLNFKHFQTFNTQVLSSTPPSALSLFVLFLTQTQSKMPGLPYSNVDDPSNPTIIELYDRLSNCTSDSRRALLRYMIEKEKLNELRRLSVEAEQRLNQSLEELGRNTTVILLGWEDYYSYGVVMTKYGDRLPNLKLGGISTSLPAAMRDGIYSHAVRDGYVHFIIQPYTSSVYC